MGVAKFGKVYHDPETEMRPVIHDLQCEEHNQVPELDLPHTDTQHRPILQPNDKQRNLQKQPLTIPQHPIKQLHKIPQYEHKQREQVVVNILLGGEDLEDSREEE